MMEEDEDYPKTLQEELNEILEAFYAMAGEEGIRQYQGYVERIMEQKIADGAIKSPDMAPSFELEDQDGDTVCLRDLLDRGPVVLVFYRGKWCPHCNATLMRLQRNLDNIEAKGAKLVAISPMMPDGTHYLATKRHLMFPVCSDIGNVVAKQYQLTFAVPPEFRETFRQWGEDIPAVNGDDTWEIPLPATYVIEQSGKIRWSFVDDDPAVRAEIEDLVAAIPQSETSDDGALTGAEIKQARPKPRKALSVTFRRSARLLFGKKQQSAPQFLSKYLVK